MLIAQKTKKTTHAYNHKLPYTPSVKLKIIPVNKSSEKISWYRLLLCNLLQEQESGNWMKTVIDQ